MLTQKLRPLFLLVFVQMAVLTGCSQELTDVEHVQRAKDFQDDGDIQTAVIELKNAARKNPNNPEARWLLGKLYVSVGNGAAGEKELQRALDLGMEPSAVRLLLGRAWFLQNNFQKVIDELDISDGETATSAAAILSLRGDAFRDLGQFDLAEKQYQKAIKASGDYLGSYVGLSRLYYKQNRLEEAKGYLQQAEDMLPTDPDVLLMRGDLFYALSDFTASEQAYTKLLALKRHGLLARLGLSMTQLANGKIDDAAKNLDGILKISPNHTYSNYLRGLVSYERQRYGTAKEYTGKVLNSVPQHLPSLLIAGASSYALAEYEQAASRLEKVVAAAPAYEFSRRLLGATHEKLGNNQLAFNILKPLVRKSVDDADLLSGIGSLAAKTGNIEEANEYLLRAAALQPESAGIRTQLALTKLSLGQLDEGLSDLSAVADMDSDSGAPEVLLAQSLLRASRYNEALEKSLQLQQTLPESSIGFVLAGIAYQNLDDMKSAEAAYMSGLKVSPGNESATIRLALLFTRTNRDQEARSVVEKSLKRNTDSDILLTALASIEGKLGNTDAKQQHLEKLLAKYPDDYQTTLSLARLYLAQTLYGQAIDLSRKLQSTYRGDPAILEVLGKAQRAKGLLKEAAGTFELLVSAMPKSPGAHLLSAEALRASGKLERSRSALEAALELRNDDASIAASLGEVLFVQQKLEASKVLYSKFSKTHPDNPGIMALGGAINLAQGNADKAVSMLTPVNKTHPTQFNTAQLSYAHLASGDADAAERVLTDWLNKSVNDVAMINQLGAIYSATKRFSDAEAIFRRFIKAQPNNWIGYNELAIALSAQNKVDEAVKVARRADEISPNNPLVIDTLGVSLMGRGDLEQAHAKFKRANELLPRNSEILLNLAQSYSLLGDAGNAKSVVAKVNRSLLSNELKIKLDKLSKAL